MSGLCVKAARLQSACAQAVSETFPMEVRNRDKEENVKGKQGVENGARMEVPALKEGAV